MGTVNRPGKLGTSWKYSLFIILNILSACIFYRCAGPIASLPPYAALDAIAIAAPDSIVQSVPALANWLTAHGQTDLEKARLLYRWITQNIYYDTSVLSDMAANSDNATDVLRTRSAVCAGYAGLYKALGQAAGLEIAEINGYAKGSHYTPGDHFDGAGNHAWIAVRIDSVWRLLDPTWGSGYMNENGSYIHEFNNYYFLVPPQELIATHFPDDPRWQLLNSPVSQETFEKSVFVKDVYFKNNIRLISPDSGVIYTKGSFTIELQVPPNVELVYTLEHDGKALGAPQSCDTHYKNKIQIRDNLTEPGEYMLKLFSRKKQESNTCKLTLILKIIVQNTTYHKEQ